MSPLNITHRDAAAGPVLQVVGELDHEQATALREEVERLVLSPGQHLVIDLSGLDFCDSTGISALLAARQRAQTAEAEVILAAVPANTLRILRIIGLDQVFIIDAGSETDATARLRGGDGSTCD
ncbi:STAS domain-containing protein [Streptomyces sp. Qhu-G9]|uniref:STAS domain-containing protein n=1 Tax=Streptomyces sp. Qhu-G9 TaxID=3452799 RepID=UPI0022AC0A58|nr:STAS domain-containing protein [Streptomyces aurantiacus]WAU83156.1 STAS domain-containing protein [Streptomyces aurantiacus]